MDLMKYLKQQKDMTRETWECLFETQEQELLVLRHSGGGGSKSNGFWIASAYFLAYSDVRDGALHQEEGRMVWALSEEEEKTRDYFHRFANDTVYRVRVRRKIKKDVPKEISKSAQNEWLVVEVVEEGVECPDLENILAEYRKPVILQDDVLGELELSREFDCFEGMADWMGEEVTLSLEVNPENKGTWTKAIKAMKSLIEEQQKWDFEMREFAAERLTALACEWRSFAGETTPEITKESFVKRIELRAVSMTSGGTFSAYFSDDDMFLGHSVMVNGSLKKGLISADIEG